MPSLTAKAVIGLTSQPKVDIALSTGRQAYVLGGSAQYDSATSSVTTWSVGAGYTAADYQVLCPPFPSVEGYHDQGLSCTQNLALCGMHASDFFIAP